MDIIIRQKYDNQDEYREEQQRHHGDEEDLHVHDPGAGDKAQHADDLAAGVDHGAGDRHDVFAGILIHAHKGPLGPGIHGLPDLIGPGCLTGPGSVAGCHQLALRIDKLQLNGVAVLIGLGVLDAGLVVGVVVHVHVLGEEVRGGPGPVAQVRLHAGVIVCRKGCTHREHAHNGQRQDHTQCVDQPPAAQARDLDQRLKSLSHAPHL